MAEMPAPAARTYRATARASLPRERLPEAAISSVIVQCGRADRAMAAGDVEGAHRALLTAQHILALLRAGLDHRRGGALAARLDALYAFLMRELGAVNLSKDRQRLARLVPVLAPLQEAWAGAAEAVLRGASPVQGGERR